MFRLHDSSEEDDDERQTSSVPFPSASPVLPPARRSSTSTSVPRTTSTPVLLVNGKPLKSSLKSSNSSPSLVLQAPRTRSEPTTPLLSQKNVHFPEGDLVSVRVFNRSARPASLSKPFGDDTETETETDNNGGAAWPAAASYFKSLAVAKPAKKSYLLDAEKCSAVPRKHEQLNRYANVHLESLQLKSSPTASPIVSGSILVRNVAFEKTVAVRFTLDHWQTTSEVLARHQASLARLPEDFLRASTASSPPAAPGSAYGLTIGDLVAKAPEWDRFSFTIKLEDYAQHLDQKTMWLVVRYTVPGSGEESGGEWWDNNASANYKLGFRPASSTPQSLPRLSFPISRSISVPSQHQKFYSYPNTITPAFPHRKEEPPLPQQQQQYDQHAQHQAALAQTTLTRLKKLNLRNYAAPSPTTSPIASPRTSPSSSRRPSVSSDADVVSVATAIGVGIGSSPLSSASSTPSGSGSGSSAETTPMSSPKATFLGLALGLGPDHKPYGDPEFGLDMGMHFQDGAPATTSPVPVPGIGMGGMGGITMEEWSGLGSSPPFSMLNNHVGFTRRHHHLQEEGKPPSSNSTPAPTPTHPPRRVRRAANAVATTTPARRRSIDSSSSSESEQQRKQEEDDEQSSRTPRPLSSSPPPLRIHTHGPSSRLISGVSVLLDEIKEKNTSPGSRRRHSGSNSGSGSGSGSGSRSSSGSSSSSSSDSESTGPIYTKSSSSSSASSLVGIGISRSPLPPPPPGSSPPPPPGPPGSPTTDSVYQAFVRQWCFAQGGNPSSPGLGVIVR